MNVSEAIVRILEREGVENIFALMSEEIIPLLSHIEDDRWEEISVFQARHPVGFSSWSSESGIAAMGRAPTKAFAGGAPCHRSVVPAGGPGNGPTPDGKD